MCQQMFVEEKMTGLLSEIMIGNIGRISWEQVHWSRQELRIDHFIVYIFKRNTDLGKADEEGTSKL